MAKLYPKILFFIGGTTPSAEQTAEADQYGPGVAFRNASLIHPDSPIEECDGVAGLVPENYAEALPNVSDREAVNDRMNARNPNLARMGGGADASVANRESAKDKQARIDNALARGQRRAPVNERNSDAVFPGERTTQSGDARVTYPDTGWTTNPETLNDAAADGRGLGSTDGEADTPGAAPLGPQGAGSQAPRQAPQPPTGGAGNPRGAEGWQGGQGDDTARIAAGALKEQPSTGQAPAARPPAAPAKQPQQPHRRK